MDVSSSDSVALLQELLRIDTTNPPGNEGPAAELLAAYLREAGLETEILISPEGRANLVSRLPGRPDKPALVLVSHTDVVAVEPDRWTRDPWGGELADGCIWGRGALDMKGIAVLQAAAVRPLAQQDAARDREVIFVAVADEEAGGAQGARWLLETHPDKAGFAEGRPPPEVLGEGGFGLSGILDKPLVPIVRGEKTALWINVKTTGRPGHGSLPPKDQANLKLAAAIGSLAGPRTPRVHPVMREQFEALAGASRGAKARLFRALASGSGTLVARALARPLRGTGALGMLLSDTITATQIHAGYKHNVVPAEASASFDCRLLPDTDAEAFLRDLRARGKRYAMTVDSGDVDSGPVSPRTPLYRVLESSSRLLGDVVVAPSLTPGFTDLRLWRRKGAAAYGFVPLVLTPELLETIHGHDERVPLEGFELAVRVMTEVVRTAAGGAAV